MSQDKIIQKAMLHKLKKGLYSDPYIFSTTVKIVTGKSP